MEGDRLECLHDLQKLYGLAIVRRPTLKCQQGMISTLNTHLSFLSPNPTTAHSSILAWEMQWARGLALQSMGLRRVEHDLATKPAAEIAE